MEQSQKHLKYYRKNIFYEKCQRKRRGDRAILEKADSATGYEIRYSTDSKMKKNVQKKVITRNKNTTLKIKKLKNNAVYYVQIRTYKLADGKKVYSAWSKAGQIKL